MKFPVQGVVRIRCALYDSSAVTVGGAGWMFGCFKADLCYHLGIYGDGSASLPHRIGKFG